MMAIATAAPQDTVRRLAQWITDLIEPKNVIFAICMLIGVGHFGPTGIGWAMLCILFSAVLPVLFIVRVVRRQGGGWAQRHLSEMQVRLAVIPVILGMVAAGLGVLWLLGAPAEVVALQVSMLATLLAVYGVTMPLRWKISGHASVSAGAVAMAVVAFGPWWLLGSVGVVVVGWSRVFLREHTVAQVVCGAVLGVSVAGSVFAWVR